MRVPGESTETVSATFTLQSSQKSGSADNSSGTLAGEVGIFYVTDTSGSVDGLTPDDDGYIAAALASDNRVTLFSAGTSCDAQNTQSLNGGSLIAFYAINTGSADDFLTDNSTNATSGSAVAFVSFDTANSDSANHFRWYGAEQVSCTAPTANSTCDTRLLHVMTAIFGGDLDFDDYTIKVELS